MIAGIVAAIALGGAVVALVVFRTWWSRKVELEFLTADERRHEQALNAPRPVEDWDVYSVTYQHPIAARPLIATFAAESAVAAFAALLKTAPGATLVKVVNVTNPGEYERGAK